MGSQPRIRHGEGLGTPHGNAQGTRPHTSEGSPEAPGWVEGPLPKRTVNALSPKRQARFQGASAPQSRTPEHVQGVHLSQRSSAHNTVFLRTGKPGNAQSCVLLRTGRFGQSFCSHRRPPPSVPALCIYPTCNRCPQAPSDTHPAACVSLPLAGVPPDVSTRANPPPPNGSAHLHGNSSLLPLPLGPRSPLSKLNMPKSFKQVVLISF